MIFLSHEVQNSKIIQPCFPNTSFSRRLIYSLLSQPFFATTLKKLPPFWNHTIYYLPHFNIHNYLLTCTIHTIYKQVPPYTITCLHSDHAVASTHLSTAVTTSLSQIITKSRMKPIFWRNQFTFININILNSHSEYKILSFFTL